MSNETVKEMEEYASRMKETVAQLRAVTGEERAKLFMETKKIKNEFFARFGASIEALAE